MASLIAERRAQLLEMMDWGSQGAELQQKNFIRFGAVGSEWVDEEDEVFVVLAPQSIVGNSIVPLLQEMVEAAMGRPVILINGRMGDVQSSAGVMSYRGRADRLGLCRRVPGVLPFLIGRASR